MTDAAPSPLPAAAPFWLSMAMFPLAAASAAFGGWTVILLPLYGFVLVSLLDLAFGHDERNPDTGTDEARLFWHRLVTVVWFPLQALTIYGMIFYATRAGHLGGLELAVLFFGVGMISGGIGITYAHELMHQHNRAERWLADLLLATVLYSHFRTEHLQVHHRHVGTPRDAATARYNEGFHRFFWRVLRDGPSSAWRAEVQRLARAGRPAWHRSNPFWLYLPLQMAAVFLALLAGGWLGLVLFLWQALVAIWQLELINYIEHYGLTRKHLGEGRYEHIRPRHSWNATHRASNWLLINLQRHSDHHCRPDRRFPLLQTYGPDEAPALPLGYPAMATLAMIPPLWRRRMNPRVRAWRRRFYPEITDWTDYNRGNLPMPKGAG
ncbi:MAG: alkane 1-monooxygenase [Rhodobacteraceae bacterium]|nr:alkane 1-monooxygenase [Paracoccaceae bacterium]